MIRMRSFWVSLGIVAIFGMGCGPKETAIEGPAPSADAMKVGIVFDSGGRGDKSFNDSAWAGLERAQKELGIEPKTVESKSEKDYETNLNELAEAGCKMIVAVGINMETALSAVAPKHPDVKFAIVDGDVKAPNVRALRFKEQEGSFLAGYLAGLMTQTNKIGFVGGQKIPLIERFRVGYEAGAKTANPNVELVPAKYTMDWVNNALAKTAATILFTDNNADIVYHAAGRAGLGVIAAASEQKKYAIGVDSDQDYLAEGYVLTSMIKRVDEAVFQTVRDFKNGKFEAGEKIYDLAANGVGLSEMKFTKEKIGAEKLAKVAAVAAQIKSGELKVPGKEDELAAYLGSHKK